MGRRWSAFIALIVLAVAGDLLVVLGVILAQQQVVAIFHRTERGRVRRRRPASTPWPDRAVNVLTAADQGLDRDAIRLTSRE